MVRFGIAGFGLHAVKRLMPGFARARNARVTALCRRDPARAAECARQYGIPHVFSSTEDLCRSPEVDAIVVATPNNCHLPDVLAAVGCGKPVLVEKPMGIHAAECRQMVDAAAQRSVLLGVAQIFRFADSVRRLREHVAAGDIGRVLLARAEFCYRTAGHPRKWIADASIAGGGPVADVGVHCVDTLRFVLGDEVASVFASAHFEQKSSVEASAILALHLRGSARAAVLVSTQAGYRTPMELVGESGVLRADDCLSVEHPVTIELQRPGRDTESETLSNALAYARQLDAFAEAVEGRAPFPAPGEEGWRNQLVLDAAYRSIRSGRVEKIG